MTETPNLPNDPRDCCRAALDVMGDEFHDSITLVHDVLALTFAALGEDVEPERVRSMLSRAQDAMTGLDVDLSKIRQLLRHGTTDHREIDAEMEEIRRAKAEGREPPYPVALMTRVLEMEEQKRQQASSAELPRV